MIDLNDFVVAYEQYEGDDLASFIHEWEQKLPGFPSYPEERIAELNMAIGWFNEVAEGDSEHEAACDVVACAEGLIDEIKREFGVEA